MGELAGEGPWLLLFAVGCWHFWAHPWHFNRTSIAFQLNFNGTSMALQRTFNVPSTELQENFNKTSTALQRHQNRLKKKKTTGASFRIVWQIQCLPYAGFCLFLVEVISWQGKLDWPKCCLPIKSNIDPFWALAALVKADNKTETLKKSGCQGRWRSYNERDSV